MRGGLLIRGILQKIDSVRGLLSTGSLFRDFLMARSTPPPVFFFCLSSSERDWGSMLGLELPCRSFLYKS